MSAASPQAHHGSESPRTVLLTRSATQGAAFARALTEECAQNGLGEPRALFAPLQQARTVEPGEEHAAAQGAHVAKMFRDRRRALGPQQGVSHIA